MLALLQRLVIDNPVRPLSSRLDHPWRIHVRYSIHHFVGCPSVVQHHARRGSHVRRFYQRRHLQLALLVLNLCSQFLCVVAVLRPRQRHKLSLLLSRNALQVAHNVHSETLFVLRESLVVHSRDLRRHVRELPRLCSESEEIGRTYLWQVRNPLTVILEVRKVYPSQRF